MSQATPRASSWAARLAPTAISLLVLGAVGYMVYEYAVRPALAQVDLRERLATMETVLRMQQDQLTVLRQHNAKVEDDLRAAEQRIGRIQQRFDTLKKELDNVVADVDTVPVGDLERRLRDAARRYADDTRNPIN